MRQSDATKREKLVRTVYWLRSNGWNARSCLLRGEDLFFEGLFFEEVGVVAVAGEELVVGAELGDAAVDEDGDAVGVAGGGDAVGDEDGGAALHGLAEAGEDLLFGVGVYAGEGIVEDEDGGIAQDGAGDGGALLLAAGEGDAALADDGAEAAGELEDLVGDVGGAGGGLDLLCRCGVRCGNAEGDVVGDGGGEEEGLLGDEADGGAKGVERVVAEGAVVEQDGVGCGRRTGAG